MIKNLINNKVYIGQAIDIKNRWKNGHIKQLNNNQHNNEHLQGAWNMYGKNNFEFSIIEECSKEKLNEREIYWIAQYKSYNREYGYNMTYGGQNIKITDEVKLKISNALKGKKLSLEHKLKISNAVKGRKYPKEFGEEISNRMKGHAVTLETRKKISNKCKGYKHTEEAKQKISKASKYRSEETLKKISKANTGKKRSEETKNKMREAAKKRKPMSEETKLKISNTLKEKNKYLTTTTTTTNR